MENFILRTVMMSISIYLVGHFTTLYKVDDYGTALVSAFVLALVNAVIKPVLFFLTFPVTIITLGLFLLVINGVMLMLVSAFVPRFRINGCGAATIASIIISLVNMLLESLLGL
jgi:putative membrane protein